MKTIESIAKSLNGKKIILRLDLNVPLNRQKITDTNRIDKIIPTFIKLIFYSLFSYWCPLCMEQEYLITTY